LEFQIPDSEFHIHMPVPWLRIVDAVIGLTDLARGRRSPPPEPPDAQLQLDPGRPGALGGLEARLAGVVVAALKEAFDRDTRRLELERTQLEAERERAERALRLELRRQAGDREIGRLRLLAGVAVASCIGTLFFSMRVLAAGTGSRIAVGGGWLLLLLAFAAAFMGQSRVAESLAHSEERDLGSGTAGVMALWLIVAGLGLVAFSVLLA
jgi:hypothetical protein